MDTGVKARISDVVEVMTQRTDAMVETLRELVETESPSTDPASLAASADFLSKFGNEALGAPPVRVVTGEHPVLRWSFGEETKVLLLGHFDTVWPLGTVGRWPFTVTGGIASGPGAFDMKAGIVQGIFALASLSERDGVTLLLTSDEELGSHDSRNVIEELGRRAQAVLVLEPGADGALKVGRKGQATYRFDAAGRASHAGLDPEAGANALTEIAHVVLQLDSIAGGTTTVTPTIASAGTGSTVIPADATLTVDVRATTIAEQERVDAALRAMPAHVPGVRLSCECTTKRPPLERTAAEALFVRARRIASSLGLDDLDGIEVGGASDGNFTAALGTPTLDGLGAVGAGAHAEGEHVVVAKMPERAALVAALVEELIGEE
jgi:glutamate carboxypeptidase